jgi:thiosulfate/3-mercaptopyruvate sulfurtransferase
MTCMLISRKGLVAGLATLGLLFGLTTCPAQEMVPKQGSGSALTIPHAELIQPEALHYLLQAEGADKPLVLQVGSHVLYAEAHIPGSDYVGAGSEAAGIQALQSLLVSRSRKQFIVLYCGCCPWNHCPNIGPAFQKLQEMGFTNVKVLYLADNFGADWVDKGYPVERGR